jgi:hypothetical protein
MDLTPYVDRLRRELAVAAQAGGDSAVELADRLTAPLDAAMRLTLLEALSVAAAEITRDLAPGSVSVQLTGRDPDFVVVRPPTDDPVAEPTTGPAAGPRGGFAANLVDDVLSTVADELGNAFGDRSGPTSRINLRLPDDVKARVEEAAGRERLSINEWLVRAAIAALDPTRTPPSPATGRRGATSHGQRYTGWAR